VQWNRVLIAELQRINSHLVWLGTHGMEVGAGLGDALLLPRARAAAQPERDARRLPAVSELHARRRLARGSAARVSRRGAGVSRRFSRQAGTSTRILLTRNTIYLQRTQGVGVISHADAIAYGLVGPIARAAGSDYDVRKYFPYLGYDQLDFAVPTRTDRRRLRTLSSAGRRNAREREAVAGQALERIAPIGDYAVADPRIKRRRRRTRVYTEMEALIQHFLIYSQGLHVPGRRGYVPVEGPRGEHGILGRLRRHQSAVGASSRARRRCLACQALEADDRRRAHRRRDCRHRTRSTW
jgi:NADH-quinone oxidoreductase subunit D